MASESRFQLTARIKAMLEEHPTSLYEVLQSLPEENYRTILQAWGGLRSEVAIVQDDRGRYRLPSGGA